MRHTFFGILLVAGGIPLLLATSSQADVRLLTAGEGASAVVFILLITLARCFPLHVFSRTEVVLDLSLIFAALLLFPIPWGALIAGLGSLSGLVLVRRPPEETAARVSIALIAAFSGQWVYVWLGGNIPPDFSSADFVFPALVTGFTLLAVHRWLAAEMLAERIVSIWEFVDPSRGSLKEFAALLLLGLYTAWLLQREPWYFVLAMPPLALVYVSIRGRLQREVGVMTQDAMETLADLIDRRDPYTAGHSKRVAALAARLAMVMGRPQEEIELIRAAGRVHDLGKMEVDLSILTKPGPLTEEEWAVIRRHPVAGAEIVSRFPEFAFGAKFVRHHHERWDGGGYPDGLEGEEIPIGARIVAVADAFDAMTSDRPYRKAMSVGEAVQEFKRGAGHKWSEQVVAALFQLIQQDLAQRSEGEGLGMARASRAWGVRNSELRRSRGFSLRPSRFC